MPEDNVIVISNLEIHSKEKYVIVSVNPKIYSLDIVYSAAYAFLDKAYVSLDGNPEEEILVELRNKEGAGDLEILGRDFNNELINYAVFKLNTQEQVAIKEQFVKKALETNSQECDCADDEKVEETTSSDIENEEDEENYLDDPLGIAKPWEEPHKDENE